MVNLTEARLLVAEYLASGVTADVFWMQKLNEQFGLGFTKGASDCLNAVYAGGYDISPCMNCGTPIVCIPDGLPMCETCAMKEQKSNG